MDSPTVVALAILGGVFLTMFAAILKSGVEGAIKMWGVMGAVTGVAIGAITSYYFADQAFQSEIQVVQQGYDSAVRELNEVTTLAGEYQGKLDRIEASLVRNNSLSQGERSELLRDLRETEQGLESIQSRRILLSPNLTTDNQ